MKTSYCHKCGAVVMSAVLMVAFMLPPAFCEKCRHEESPHLPEVPSAPFVMNTVQFIMTSSIASTRQS